MFFCSLKSYSLSLVGPRGDAAASEHILSAGFVHTFRKQWVLLPEEPLEKVRLEFVQRFLLITSICSCRQCETPAEHPGTEQGFYLHRELHRTIKVGNLRSPSQPPPCPPNPHPLEFPHLWVLDPQRLNAVGLCGVTYAHLLVVG